MSWVATTPTGNILDSGKKAIRTTVFIMQAQSTTSEWELHYQGAETGRIWGGGQVNSTVERIWKHS